MHKYFYLIFSLLVFGANASIDRDPGEHLYPHIRKIDNGLYFAKIPGHDLYFVMEQVTGHNIEQWKQYASIQSNDRVISWATNVSVGGGKLAKNPPTDGSAHFKKVLSEIPSHADVWVAYITSNPVPQHIPYSMKHYSADDTSGGEEFSKNIKMYVSVTSSPEALVTSHMGVAFSVESLLLGRPSGISVPLHSFAAQVMLCRNPHRRYMINAPALAMERILLKALPHSVFIGTREMRHQMEKSLHSSLEEFLRENPHLEQETLKKKLKSAEKELRRENRVLKEDLSDRESTSEEQIIQNAIESLSSSYLKMGPAKEFIISDVGVKQVVQESMRDDYSRFKNPYEAPNGERNSQVFLEFMKKHPPILSVDQGKFLEKKMIIYEGPISDRIWLSIEKGNPHYKWLFMNPFQPAGITHFVVTDLKALADAAPVEGLR